MKTCGVFALLLVRDGPDPEVNHKILLSDREDGKGWNLPGGKVLEGETNLQALIREVREETGLEIEVLEQVGPFHDYQEDRAIAFSCTIIGGQLLPSTKEAKQNRYVSKGELKSLKIVGPDGRLGRMGRMIYDGLSILEKATCGPTKSPPEFLPIEGIWAEGEILVEETIDIIDGREIPVRNEWKRLDPHLPTGYMEPAAPPPQT